MQPRHFSIYFLNVATIYLCFAIFLHHVNCPEKAFFLSCKLYFVFMLLLLFMFLVSVYLLLLFSSILFADLCMFFFFIRGHFCVHPLHDIPDQKSAESLITTHSNRYSISSNTGNVAYINSKQNILYISYFSHPEISFIMPLGQCFKKKKAF